ncbi:FimV/HubP family polar landmark protein [Salinisphaera hydrothermalis]|uniref:FimV/HubP family polar landmark protein n=1 Tax=Salinisphaera hydrothermalis TaxID=563188 RepID=UPI003342D712
MAVFIDRAIRRGLIAASIAVAGYAAPAFALEFGALDVHSHLNQPLDATVVLSDLDASERASLDVGIAPPAMFQRFGIRRSSAVDRIHIDTTMTDGGRRAVVHIATRRPVNEPFVDFLLQVESGNGSALREYTALLNPASEAANTAPSMPATHRAAAFSTSRAVPSHSTHRVQAGETLWSIAAANTPPGATVAQTMLAIYRANPSAFNGSMSALSGNARLTIPSAARIQAVDATKAEQQLVDTRQATGNASSKSPETGNTDAADKVVANGEAPPARLKQGATSSTPPAEDSTPGRGTSNADTSNQASSASPGAFGTLSLPSDVPWTAPQTPAPAPESQTAASSTSAATQTTAASTPAPAATPSTTKPGDQTTAATTKTAPGTSPQLVSHDTPPPTDVAEADGGTWLSPRNLLLLIVLLGLIALVLRRLRERGYKRVELDREPAPEPTGTPASTAAPAASGPETVADADRSSTPVHKPAPREAEPTPVPAAADRRTSVSHHSAPDTPPTGEPESAPTGSPKVDEPHPTPPRRPAPAALEMPELETTAAPQHAEAPKSEAGPAAAESGMPSKNVVPMRFEQVDRPASGPRLDPHRRAATNEEIEALAFETQSLPETAERQHDRGGDDGSAMPFIETDQPGGDRDETTTDEVRRPDPYGLEMIDPGEFDLYDPPSDTAGPSDDDPNHSVEIRLDLARMYIEMDDDQAARELLADVRERGDAQQRDEAGRLLERLDA